MAPEDQTGSAGRAVANSGLEHPFSVMLTKTIEAVQRDPSYCRNFIYEMARVQLKREAWQRDPPMNILELRRMMLALETAIERVETDAAERDALLGLGPDLSAVAPDATPY